MFVHCLTIFVALWRCRRRDGWGQGIRSSQNPGLWPQAPLGEMLASELPCPNRRRDVFWAFAHAKTRKHDSARVLRTQKVGHMPIKSCSDKISCKVKIAKQKDSELYTKLLSLRNAYVQISSLFVVTENIDKVKMSCERFENEI